MFPKPIPGASKAIRHYAERAQEYDWSIDRNTGFWVPVKGDDGFGQHTGTDFEAKDGVLVRALADGIIIRSRRSNSEDCHTPGGFYILQLVMLPGYDSWTICYSNLEAVFTKPGFKVFHGEPIGQTGVRQEDDFVHVDLMNLQRQWKPIQFSD